FRHDVVGTRLNDDAMSRDQRIELNEFLRFQEAARRSPRRHYEQGVDDLGAGETVKLRRRVERDGDARTSTALRDADQAERLGRLEHRVADDAGPGEALGADAGELRLVELELNHLSVARTRERGVADAAARLRGDLVDID